MLAKGHHFPRLTLVVIVDADNGFYNQDFRALEQLGQLLIQVSGRAGRAEHPGQVIIQTHQPDHPMLNMLVQRGYEAFAHSLLQTRQEAHLPPYCFLALLRIEGRQQDLLLQILQTLKQRLNLPSNMLLGPAPAPLSRKANLHRMQLLLKTTTRKQRDELLAHIRQWFSAQANTTAGTRWYLDVDPLDLS